jgi:exosome complex component RRP41
MLNLGQTKILTSVYGPYAMRDVDASANEKDIIEENNSHCIITVEVRYGAQGRSDLTSFKPEGVNSLNRIKNDDEKELSKIVGDAVRASIDQSQYDNTCIDVHVHVLQSNGGVLDSSVNCASLALADAKIKQLDTVTACTVAVLKTANETETEGYVLVADPSFEETKSASGLVTVVMLPTLDKMVSWSQTGRVPVNTVHTGIDMCKVRERIERALRKTSILAMNPVKWLQT